MIALPPAFVVSCDASRLAQFKTAWDAVGLPPNAVREWKGVKLHGRNGDGQLGNAIAQYSLIRHAIASGFESILVFEDDAIPCDSAAVDLPRELDAARSRGDAAIRLGWLPDSRYKLDDEEDGAILMGSHAYALLTPRAMEDYCDAWTRNGKADYIFGVMMGRVGKASRCLFAQHVPSGKQGIHFPSGWVRIHSREDLRDEHASFIKASAAIGTEPPNFSGKEMK